MSTIWRQRLVQMAPRRRGLHLITAEILEKFPEIFQIQTGWRHVFVPRVLTATGQPRHGAT